MFISQSINNGDEDIDITRLGNGVVTVESM